MKKRILKTLVTLTLTAVGVLGFAFPSHAATVNVTFVTPYGNYVYPVEQGGTAIYSGPTDINVPGYAFCGWDVPLSPVMADTVATAVYLPIGSAGQSVDVCNTVRTLPNGILSYSTAGAHSMSEGTNLVTSPYPATPVATVGRIGAEDSIRMNPVGVPGKTCVVRWYNGSSGQLWYTDVVAYGSTLPAPENPCITGLEFVGWDGSWTNITEDRNIIACFYRTYKVLYVHADDGALLATKNLRITDDLLLSAKSINMDGRKWPGEWDQHWVSDDKVVLIADPDPDHNDYYGDDDNHSHKYDWRKWVEAYR
ncbi:MAG: hypothetical protein IKR56_04625 [Lachnospiraceae bacterium]|nr:hypothetical protein [Lachnospiraceae bacterium]MBR4174605.1 hypothetical protein [Lachnospiraceae bacterium]